MIKLSSKASGPFWMTVGKGISLQLKPVRATTIVAVGRTAANAVLATGGTREEASEAFTIAVAKWAVIGWKGIGDEKGKVIEPTPERVEQLLAQKWNVYEKFNNDYVLPVLLQDDEKNASSASPNGTSASAGKATAPRVRAGAKPAPTTKTPAKPKKAKRSGT